MAIQGKKLSELTEKVENIQGTERIYVSDGSGVPKYINTNQMAKSSDIPQADGEDISLEQNKMKFADRAYNPSEFSGKGYKILRKNIVNGKNILTQEMIMNLILFMR